jgi:hypothetical protein
MSYYPSKLFNSYCAQALKDPYWAMQYYTFINRIRQSEKEVYSKPEPPLPSSVEFYAILNENSIPSDVVSNEFYRQSKIGLASTASNNNIIMLEWCSDVDCTSMFPINKAKWTAGVIAQMLGG